MKRYPLQNLIDAVGLTNADLPTAELGRRLGMAYNTVQRARRSGLTEAAADRYAVGLGFVPGLVWPEWIDDSIDDVSRDCAASDCPARFVPSNGKQRFCSRRCHRRVWSREKYASDPQWAARKREARRAYHAEVREYENAQASRRRRVQDLDRVKAKRRAWYEANAEKERAKRRERYAANAEVERARQRARYAAKRVAA